MLMRAIPVLLVLLCLLTCCADVRAQAWVELMMDGTTNIHEVKAEFDAYWDGRPYQKGKGWKQFQRWHWFMDQRTHPSGERLDPAVYMQAAEELRAMRAAGAGDRDDAVWQPLGPTSWSSTSYNPGNGRVNTIAVDPSDPAIIHAGTPASGLWRSNDGGLNWQPLFTDLPSMGVSGIVIDTAGSGTIYIATGDGDGSDTWSAGVLKSTDDGVSWQSTGLNWTIGQNRTARALRIDPMNSSKLLCATSEGLYRTVNAGTNWQPVATGGFRDVEFMPGDTDLVLACTDQLYRSTNGGAGFAVSGSGLPSAASVGRMAIAISTSEPHTVYALCGRSDDNGFLGLYASTDGGLTFELRSATPNIFGYDEEGSDEGGQAWYDMALAVDPLDGNTVYAGGINVWKSIDGGVTWEIVSHWVWPSNIGYTHADIHSLDFFGQRLYCGSDGGLHFSDDGGAEWTDASTGLDIMQFYRMGGSELQPELIMAGAQDNGTNRYLNGAWTHVMGADGMEAAVDVEFSNVVYATSQNGGLNRSDSSGVHWIDIRPTGEDGAWVTPFAVDPSIPGHLIAGYANVWTSYDRGGFWEQSTFWDDDEFVRCLAMAPSDGFYIYAGRDDLIQRSWDGGNSWTDIDQGLPNLSPTSFAVDHADPYHVWISFSGTAPSARVYESFDAGLTWTNRSQGLPALPVNSIVFQPGSPNGIYAATDLGVFYRDNFEPTWQPYGVGMPNVVVSELEINMATSKLRAATYGRGIWETDLYISPFATVMEQAGAESPRVLALDHAGRFLVRAGSDRYIGSVRVLDAAGRELIARQAMADGEAQIDLSARTKGIYLFIISTDAGQWCRRVVR